MDYIKLEDRVIYILKLCRKHISYEGHFIRKLPEIIIVPQITKEILKEAGLQSYSTVSQDLIKDRASTVPGGYDKNTLYIASLNTLNDMNLVFTIVHEFTHCLQDRFGKKFRKQFNYSEAPFELEAQEFERKFGFEIYHLYIDVVKNRFLKPKTLQMFQMLGGVR